MTNALNLLELPNIIIIRICDFITNTDDYNNFKLTNKHLYNLFNIIKIFENNICIQQCYNSYQYYINILYFPNKNIKLESKYYLDDNLDKIKTNIEKEYYKNGPLKRITNFKNGVKDGLEKIYYENFVLRRQSYYKDGKKQNKELINEIDGSLRYLLNYNNDYIYLKKYVNRDLCYDISLKNNNIHGICKYYMYGKLRKDIKFNNGLIDGFYKNYKIIGLDDIITYKKNKKNGIFNKYNFLKYIKITGNYKDDKLDGIISFFIGNKIIKTIQMSNNIMNGKYIEYNDNKKVYFFKNNKLNGYYTEYTYTKSVKYKIKFCENMFGNIFKVYDIYGDLDKEYLFIDNDYIIKKYVNNNLLFILHKINDNYYISYNNIKIKLY